MIQTKKTIRTAAAGVLGTVLLASALALTMPASAQSADTASVTDAASAADAALQARSCTECVSYTAQSAVPVIYHGADACCGSAILWDGLTYVPLRTFCNQVSEGGAGVTWNAQAKTATVKTDTLTLTAGQGALYITANGRCFYTAGAVINRNGTLYVPLRPMAKAFGLDVEWDAGTRSVTLAGNARTYRLAAAEDFYNADDLYWLSRIISAESKGEPFTGQIAVGNVVLNRVASPDYPGTVWGVIFDRRYGTQFTPAASGTVYNTPTESARAAAKICLEGYTLSPDAIYFFNPAIATSSWISRSCTYLFTIGGHSFYR